MDNNTEDYHKKIERLFFISFQNLTIETIENRSAFRNQNRNIKMRLSI